MNLLVDFSSIYLNNIKINDSKSEYSIDYDDLTTKYYKSHRIQKTDPITFEELKDSYCFSYYNIWNPYTGSILINDPFGPLCFNPETIISHLYYSRLNNLWVELSDEKDALYSGYYGDCVGIGEDFEIINKGNCPEKYIFRLPITNCYLKKNHNMNTITIGPKLTDDDIYKLDCIMSLYYKKNIIYKKIGSVLNLKKYYDIAISKIPDKLDFTGLNIDIQSARRYDNPNDYINRCAVDILRIM